MLKIVKVSKDGKERETLAERGLPNSVGWTDDGEFFFRLVAADQQTAYHVYLGKMSNDQAMAVEEAITGLEVDADCFPQNPTEREAAKTEIRTTAAMLEDLRREDRRWRDITEKFLAELKAEERDEFLFHSHNLLNGTVNEISDIIEDVGVKLGMILHHLKEHPGEAFDMKLMHGPGPGRH